jgi:hypothetical protein
MLEEFQGSFGVVNKNVLLKNNILVVINENNVMLDFEFNTRLRNLCLPHVVKNEKDLGWPIRKSIIFSVAHNLEYLYNHIDNRYYISNKKVEHVKGW